MYKYYLTKRPAAPGSIPAGATEVINYDNKTHIDIIGREAWAVVVYPEALTDQTIKDYELTPEQEPINRKKLERDAGLILMKSQGIKGREALETVQALTITELQDIIKGC